MFIYNIITCVVKHHVCMYVRMRVELSATCRFVFELPDILIHSKPSPADMFYYNSISLLQAMCFLERRQIKKGFSSEESRANLLHRAQEHVMHRNDQAASRRDPYYQAGVVVAEMFTN